MEIYEIREKIERECLSRALELVKKAVPTNNIIGTAAQLAEIANEMREANKATAYRRAMVDLWKRPAGE